MLIFINGDKWSDRRLSRDWKSYAITENNFEKLKNFELVINTEKTTATTLAFLTKTELAAKKEELKYKNELRMWTEKVRKVLLNSIIEMDAIVQNQYTLLEKYLEKKRTLPSFELLQTNFAEIFAFLETKVESGELEPMPLPKQ